MKRMIGLGRLGMLALVSLGLGACIFGGTGSDHENGVSQITPTTNVVKLTGISARVVDGDGLAIPGVSLYLYDPGFRPDLGLLRSSQLLDSTPTPVTDSLGYVTLALRTPGKYVVEGIAAGKTLFFDTLAAPDLKKATPFTFRARALAFFQGKVSLASGMRIDSGSVFIRGTSRAARIDAAGAYDLGALPSDVARMGVGIRYVSSPTSVQESKQVSVIDTGKIGPVVTQGLFTCKDVVSKDSTALILAPALKAPIAETTVSARKVDSTQVGQALNACDTLPRGGVINVVSQDSMIRSGQKDSIAVPMLVLKNEESVVSFGTTKVMPATVIPYAGCVPTAGSESTSFDVKVQTTSVKSDILIADVAAQCLEK